MYSIVFIFTFYAFLGWLFESAMKTIRDKKWVNSGFLFGPFTPIYGFGALMILAVGELSFGHWWLQILLSMAVATILEYGTAIILERFFHKKWWDYSHEFLNYKGRVCIRFSLIWGVFGFLLLNFIHPSVMASITWHPMMSMELGATIIVGYFAIDVAATIGRLLRHKKDYNEALDSLYRRVKCYLNIK